MSKKHYSPLENSANQQNSNKGTSGFNQAYRSAMNNHSNQLNPNNFLYCGSSSTHNTHQKKK